MTDQPKAPPGRRRIPLEIRLSFPVRLGVPEGDAERARAHLEVRDAASGQLLADVEFGPEQLLDLLRGALVEAVGETSLHLGRVGKVMETSTQPLGDVPEAVAEEAALNYRAAGEWDTVKAAKARSHRAGSGFAYHLTLRRWRKDWEG